MTAVEVHHDDHDDLDHARNFRLTDDHRATSKVLCEETQDIDNTFRPARRPQNEEGCLGKPPEGPPPFSPASVGTFPNNLLN